MILRLPVVETPDWVRRAAVAVNSLLNRVDALEAPRADDVRYHAGVLEYWDGSAWQPVP